MFTAVLFRFIFLCHASMQNQFCLSEPLKYQSDLLVTHENKGNYIIVNCQTQNTHSFSTEIQDNILHNLTGDRML